jgi:hypothetical protein
LSSLARSTTERSAVIGLAATRFVRTYATSTARELKPPKTGAARERAFGKVGPKEAEEAASDSAKEIGFVS